MSIRQRAIQASDKQERHAAILDAAERLLVGALDRVPNVAEVADEAGLAKGTVYLYFASKEELLLAVHERNLDDFFRALDALLAGTRRVTIDDLLAVTNEHIVSPVLFLPLAARCFALMAHSIPAPAANAFRERMAARLERAGAGIERHFPRLAAGEGVARLRHSFALTLGLWQMSSGAGCAAAIATVATSGERVNSTAFVRDYPQDLARALRALWQSVSIAPEPPAR
jgi:AcrR family transcriptional regulator